MTDEWATPWDAWAPPRSAKEQRRAQARAASAAGLAAPRSSIPAGPVWLTWAAALAGLVGAIGLPGAPPGLALALTALAVAMAIAPALRGRLSLWTATTGVIAVGLACLCAVRDAEWIVGLDLVAAFALGSIALGGGRSFRDLIKSAASVVLVAPMAPAHIAKPTLAHAFARRRRSIAPALRAAGVSAVLLVVFGALFASADAAFGVLLGRLIPSMDVAMMPARVAVFLLVATLVSAGALVAGRVSPVGVSRGLHAFADALLVPFDPGRVRSHPARLEWMAPLVVLDALFTAFVGVQLAVFFGGREHLLSTPGLTAAEYARSGFFQLVTVCLLTLAVVALAVRYVDPIERLRLRLLLGPLCALSAVVLVSAALRLHHYEQAFGYTRLRLFVTACMAVIGVVLALLLLAGAAWRAWWLPRAIVLTVVGALLALNAINADAFIARRNIERARGGAEIDTYYLSGLSADAASELLALPEPARSCVFSGMRARLDRLAEGGWRAANLSRSWARDFIDGYGLGHGQPCRSLTSARRTPEGTSRPAAV